MVQNHNQHNLNLLRENFASALNISPSIVTEDLAYQSIPEWDSISHMVLISQLEDVFKISIDMDDVIDMSTVGKAVEILRKYEVNI